MNANIGLNAALAALRSGDSARARAICADVLRHDPAHADVLRLSGLIACQSGSYESAVGFFERSLTSNPRQAIAHANLGGALVMLGRSGEAILHCEQALALQPRCAEAHYSRGCALYALERHQEAIADFDAALQAMPQFAPALLNRGNAQHRLGRLDEALASLERVLSLNSNDALALYNRGNVLRDLGRLEEALASYDQVLALNLRSGELLNNRGNVLRDLGRLGAAAEAYEQALELQPDAIEPLNNRGIVLLDLNRPREAIACFERVLRIRPDFATALDNQGLALRMDERPDEAIRAYADLLRVAPDFKGVRTNLHHTRSLCCDWSRHSEEADAVIASVQDGRPGNPFPLLAIAPSPALQRRAASVFAEAEGWRASETSVWAGRRYVHERIRIGYVSADFRQHAVSLLLAGVLEHHDRDRFEITGISLRPEEHTPFGQRIRSAFDRFIDATHLTDRGAAETIRDLESDIVVDLMGYTRFCRPGIFAQRPAPVQVNFLGYPGSMGVPFMDYIIADDFVIPHSAAHHYVEQIVYLPDCFQPNDDRRMIGATPTRAEAGLPEHGFVFCSFNNSYKFNPEMFAIWVRLLSEVPDSILWLAVENRVACDNLRREAARCGVDPGRLVLARRLPYPEHLGRLSLADLFLDTLPFNAGTTASDALWAGVPVLTCVGDAFASRMAGSLLRAVGIPDLITSTLEDYERLALALAQQPERLRQLRLRLAFNRDSHPLFDTARYCRHLEAAYTAMHAEHQRGGRPASIVVPPTAY